MTLARPPRARDMIKENRSDNEDEIYQEEGNNNHETDPTNSLENGEVDYPNGKVPTTIANSEVKNFVSNGSQSPSETITAPDFKKKMDNIKEETMGPRNKISDLEIPSYNENLITDNVFIRADIPVSENTNGTLTKTNDFSGEKLEVITEDDTKDEATKVPVVIITSNDSFERRNNDVDVRRSSLDIGFYESRKRASDDQLDVSNKYATVGSDVPLKRVDFKIGGGDDTESESSRRSSVDERSVPLADVRLFKRGRPITDYKDNEEYDGDESSEKFEPNYERKSYDAEKGFVRASEQRKMPVDIRRSFSVDDGSNSGSNIGARHLQDTPRPVSFSDESIKVIGSAGGSRKNSTASNSGGMTGILKKSASPNRLESSVSDRNLERETLSPSVSMSEGLRRYRRRSQLSISSEIPTDVSLKQRQVENGLKNKENLEFIKRRISLQHELPEKGGGAVGTAVEPRRGMSSSGHVDEANEDYNSYSEQIRSYGDLRSPSPINNGYYADSETSRFGRNGSGTSGVENGRMPRNPSRESIGERIVVHTELSDEEINEYLGNFQPYERPYEMPPSPRDLEPPKRMPGFSVQQPGIAVTQTSGIPAVDACFKQRNASPNATGQDEEFVEPYVPIRKQRANSGSQPAKVNQSNTTRMPEKVSLPVRSSGTLSTSLASQNSLLLSHLSLAGQRFAANISKDSIALFNNKLNGAGPGRLRRFSQASIAEFEELKRKHV